MSYTVSAADLSAVHLNEQDPVKAKLQEIATLLSTRQGSIPLFRQYGLPQRFLDMPVNAGIPVMIAEVTEAIQEFVPGVELIEVIPAYDKDRPGKLMPAVEVRISDEES